MSNRLTENLIGLGRLSAAAPAANILLRAGVGALLVPHGAQKLFG